MGLRDFFARKAAKTARHEQYIKLKQAICGFSPNIEPEVLYIKENLPKLVQPLDIIQRKSNLTAPAPGSSRMYYDRLIEEAMIMDDPEAFQAVFSLCDNPNYCLVAQYGDLQQVKPLLYLAINKQHPQIAAFLIKDERTDIEFSGYQQEKGEKTDYDHPVQMIDDELNTAGCDLGMYEAAALLSERLAQAYPNHREEYTQNAKNYREVGKRQQDLARFSDELTYVFARG